MKKVMDVFLRGFQKGWLSVKSGWKLWRDTLPDSALYGLALGFLPMFLYIMQARWAADALMQTQSLGAGRSGGGVQESLQLLSMLMQYGTRPFLFAALIIIMSARLMGVRAGAKRALWVLRSKWSKVLIASVLAMLFSGMVGFLGRALSGVVSLLFGLFAFIPVLGDLLFWIGAGLSLVVLQGVEVITHAIVVFALCGYLKDGLWGNMLTMHTMQRIWGGRITLLPALAFMAAAWAVGYMGAYGVGALMRHYAAPAFASGLLGALFYTGALMVSAGVYIVLYHNQPYQGGTVLEAEVL